MELDNKPTPVGREQKQVNRIYAAFVAMVIFLCVPYAVFSVVGILLLFYVMFSAYGLRRKYPEESLVHNHMTYLIRSFWISSLLCLIGFIAAGLYLMKTMDPNELMASTTQTMNDAMATGQVAMNADMKQVMMVSLVTMGPSVIYLIYRAGKGLSRALKGFRMGNPKEWF